MIDWHHPRIYERLRCFGLCLFTLGVASHNVDNPPAALAAIVVTALLIVRLKIELDIKRDEEEYSLERKVHRIRQINTMEWTPKMRQGIKTHRRKKENVSHGIVSAEVHTGIQGSRCAAAGAWGDGSRGLARV